MVRSVSLTPPAPTCARRARSAGRSRMKASTPDKNQGYHRSQFRSRRPAASPSTCSRSSCTRSLRSQGAGGAKRRSRRCREGDGARPIHHGESPTRSLRRLARSAAPSRSLQAINWQEWKAQFGLLHCGECENMMPTSTHTAHRSLAAPFRQLGSDAERGTIVPSVPNGRLRRPRTHPSPAARAGVAGRTERNGQRYTRPERGGPLWSDQFH